MRPIVEVKNLITEFGNNRIHDGINFSVKEGEIFGILGGSGAGKSVLMRQMLMLQKPTHGSIILMNREVGKITVKEHEEIQQNIGVLFQFGALFSSLNVLENIAIGLKEYTKLSDEIINDIAYSKLSMVGLHAKSAYLYPSELSGGMKKRVGLARALALDPKILFLDEPTSGLDPYSARAFDTLISELKEMLELTVIMITHDLETITYLLERFVLLHDKKILLNGNIDDARELKHHHAIEEFFMSHKGYL